MKTIKYILLTILFSFLVVGNTFAATCDQTFENNFVRYNYSYDFFDTISNNKPGSTDLYLNTWTVDYINSQYLDKGIAYSNGNDWDWTQSIKNAGYKVVKGTTNLKILSTKSDDWRIAQHPTTRTTSKIGNYDFMISYKIGYDYSNNFPNASDDLYHTECAYYSVTWCGDGIVDSSYGEQCDDGNNLNGDTCSSTCKDTVVPVCSAGITGAQLSPISASTANLCDNVGETVINFSSSLTGNTTNYTWNCKAGNVVKTGGDCTASYTNKPNFVCDQIFENNFVRYNYSYDFFDTITNDKPGSADLYLNTWQIDYNNPEFLDKGITHDNGNDWDWTQAVKNANYKIVKGTKNLKILSTKASDWRIAKHPITKTPAKQGNHDFMISYKIGYDYSNNYPDASDDLYITECAYYSVTWCGDGVVDSTYGEQCDDGNNIDGDSCSSTCKQTSTPVCNAGVTGTQTSSISSSTTNLCKNTGETVINFSSSVNGNTTNYLWSCTDGTSTFSGGNCSANYTPSTTTSSGGGSSCLIGTVTGIQTSAISASTAGLCQIGLNVGNFTSTVTGNTTYYTWECGGIGGGSCTANYTPSTTTSSGGGSSCLIGTITGVQTSPISASTAGLCQIGLNVGNFTSTVTGNTTNYSWSCGGISGGACYASYSTSSTSSSGGGGSSSSGGGGSSSGGGNTYCGDGRVQRPNSDSKNEECDFGSATDRLYCNRDCTYGNNTIPGHCQNNGSCEITTPNGGAMIFGPSDNVIIGTGMNPYIAHGLGRPYIRNNSDYDLYFDQICVVKKTGSTIVGNSICATAGIIEKGKTKYYPNIPDFVGSNISSGNYGDNTIITTIKHDGMRYDNAYFISKLDVRVAKSSVATTGGGTSYLSDTTSIGNISDVANNGKLNPDDNKNFVGVGVSSGDISSYSNDITDTESVNTIDKQGDKYSQSIDKVSNTVGTTTGDTSLISDFQSYNGIENVFILKNKNFVVESGTFIGITGSRTYIIENGNLKINANIAYPDNIAFVVKGGNIQILKDVTRIDGTYITIVKDSIGGKFQGTGGSTFENKLTVNGSLYGNINDLISKRTYVKQNSANQIDVGTIVSFGSKLFRKPAPLISTFINEYLQSEKISN